jgi:hypothetical protein
MLGKEHILSTLAVSIALIFIIIFQKFYHITSTLAYNQILIYIFSLPPIDYIYLSIFFAGMIIASTAPDIDVEEPLTALRRKGFLSNIWFNLIKYIAYTPTALFLSIFRKNEVGHRKIFHSIFGAVFYSISIVIIFIIFISLFLFTISLIQNPSISENAISSNTISTISFYLTNSELILKYFWNYVYVFLIGSILGFLSHLYEDSTTVSGIAYLPFITSLGLKGRLRTGSKQFYQERGVNFLGKTKFGMFMFWIYNLLFIYIYFAYSLYLHSLTATIIMYLIFSFVFLMITCGLKPAKIIK